MMRRALLALICSTSLGHTQCYVASDLASVTPSGVRVAQPSSCAPIDNSTTYKYYPLTQGAAFDMTPELTSTTTQCQAIASLWANRWDGGPSTHKPNPPAGPEVDVDDGVHGSHTCNLDYTSLAIAEAADKSEAYWLYGYASHFTNGRGWLDASEAVSIPDASNMTFTDFQTNAATLCTGWDATDSLYYAQNIVVRPNVRLPDLPANLQAWGIKYDYEPHDGRSALDTKALVTSIVNAGVRFGYLVSFYVNPLDGPQTPNSGVDATNIDAIANKVAVFEMIVSHVPNGGVTMDQSLANQLAMFASPPNLSKFNYVIDPAMTPTQAHTMRPIVVANGFGGFDDWPDGQAAGGSCPSNYNQVLGIMYGLIP